MNSKRIALLAIVLAIVASGIVAAVVHYRSKGDEAKETKVEKAKDIYFCPMHPTVTSDGPSNCPICGMALVKRTADPAAAHLEHSGAVDSSLQAVSLSPEQRVTANVQTMVVEFATGTGDVITTGRVTFDERRLAQVTAYTAGRIERLNANFTGEAIRRGQAVATIYSPELFATQQEYLLAIANRERMERAGFDQARSASQDLVVSTRRRLELFGMTPQQIGQLERGGKPLYTTSIISPVSGIVTRKLVVPQQYVALGQPLFEIADLSTVWVEADVYEQQLPSVKVGQKVMISNPAAPAKELEGTVSFIQPVFAGQTRTAKVRVELANPGMQLKPDMYVRARLIGEAMAEHIMLPATAVIDRGQKKFVWVQTAPGSFEPREVTSSGRHGDMVVIASGLSGGETIVLDGAFLLDSEAQLRSATSAAAEHAGH